MRLRRLLAVHNIRIPQLAPANPSPTKAVEPVFTTGGQGGVRNPVHVNMRSGIW